MWRGGHPDGVEVLTLSSGVEVRLYRPTGGAGRGPALLWIHGGGYILGDAAQDDVLCQRYARKLGATVASVNYRLAPEHPYPARRRGLLLGAGLAEHAAVCGSRAGGDRRGQCRRRTGRRAGAAGPGPRRDRRWPRNCWSTRCSTTASCCAAESRRSGAPAVEPVEQPVRLGRLSGRRRPGCRGAGAPRRISPVCRRRGSASAPWICSTTRTSRTPSGCRRPGCRVEVEVVDGRVSRIRRDRAQSRGVADRFSTASARCMRNRVRLDGLRLRRHARRRPRRR